MQRTVTTTSKNEYFSNEVPIHINRMTESFRLEQHRHEFYEFSYVGEGKGFHYIEDESMPVAKGDFFYLPIGVSHVFRPSTPTPEAGRLIVYNCIFDERFADVLLRALGPDSRLRGLLTRGYPEQPWLRMRDGDGAIQRIFDSMLSEFSACRPEYMTMLQAEALRLLAMIGRQSGRSAGSTAGETAPDAVTKRHAHGAALDAAAEAVRLAPGEEHRAASYAAAAGWCERHFRRRFKERFGLTFLDYVHKCRIELCCELLTSTNDKVAAIGQQAGFRDLKHFNELFRRTTGQTPTELRQSAASVEIPLQSANACNNRSMG